MVWKKNIIKTDYDMVLNWVLTFDCNFRCTYCNNKYCNIKLLNLLQGTTLGRFITEKLWDSRLKSKKNEKYVKPLNVNPSNITSILEQMGRTAKIRLLDGEPFLFPDMLKFCSEFTQKHYIDIESNLTINRVKQFCDTINPARVGRIRAAFHIEELEKKKLINRYIENFLYCQQKGFNIEALVVVYPPVMKKVLHYKNLLQAQGITLHALPFVGHYNTREYPAAYTKEEIKNLQVEVENASLTRATKGQYCIAGHSFLVVYPSGIVLPCYQIHRDLGNISEGFTPYDSLKKCPHDRCFCDPYSIEPTLFDYVLNECPELESKPCSNG